MGFKFDLEPGKMLRNRYRNIIGIPLISIITPYFNSGKYFSNTYNCVINQSFPWFEWIIVNDSRTNENDKKILEEYGKKDTRILILHTGEMSISQARNYAIKQSKSNIIIPLDADDLVEPTYFEYLYFALVKKEEASWSYTDNATFHDQQYLWKQVYSSDTMKKENIAIYSAAIRKKAIEEVEGYSEIDKHFNEDWHFWLKLLANNRRPVHIENVLFWYRWSDTGALARFQKDAELIKENKKLISSVADKVPDGIRAITFGGKRTKEFEKPEKWEWDRKLPFAEEKTRILMLLPHMECGGADKFNLDIIKNINRDKYEIGIITTVPAESEWRQEFTQYADDVFELPSFLDMSDWAGFIHYYIYSRDIKILINISSYYGYYTLPWLRTEFPEIAIIDFVHAEGRYWRAGGYPRVSAAVDSVIDKTFVTNGYTRNMLVEKYGKKREKTQVIYTGVDETEFKPWDIDGTEVKKLHGIDEKRPVVLYLCRMAPEKRPFLMLEIAKEVRKKIPDICFMAVGGGPQLEELRKKAVQEGLQGTVYFTGRVDDIKPYYKAGNVFLLCSIKEGLSITTLEAMFMEMPVVSADVGSQYELVGETTGKLIKCRQDEEKDFDSRSFSKEEIGDYSKAICELIEDSEIRTEIGKACREKILNGFTLNIMINTLESEFTELCCDNAVNIRKKQSDCIVPFADLMEDYLTIYQTLESKDLEAAEIWGGREWYRSLYEKECAKNNSENISLQSNVTNDISQSMAEQRLQEIYNMRTWKVIEKYRNIMDNTFVGRVLRKIRDIGL